MKNRSLKKTISGFLLALSFFVFPSVSFADFKSSPWVEQKNYLDKISHKAGFGLLNIATGWTAIFFEPYYEGWKGFGTGPLYTITNTAGGILHVATFPIPFDVPLPEGGVSHEYDR